MQILHRSTGTIQRYSEELSDPDRYRPDHCPQCEAHHSLRAHSFYRISRSTARSAFGGTSAAVASARCRCRPSLPCRICTSGSWSSRYFLVAACPRPHTEGGGRIREGTRATGNPLSAPTGLQHFLLAARAAAAEVLTLEPLDSTHDQDETAHAPWRLSVRACYG
jgi:hypothetical protein